MTASPVFGAILAAGYGSRLAPLTEVLPKPLLPFFNTPLIAYALDHLLGCQVELVGINTFHLAETIPPVVDRLAAHMGVGVRYAREWELLGTAGGIRGIWQALGSPSAPLVVLNGDAVMDIDLQHHLHAHRQAGALATLVARPKHAHQPGRVFVDPQGQLAGLRHWRRPGAHDDDLVEHDFCGVHILEPELLRTIALEPADIITAAYGPLLEQGAPLHVSIHEGFWAALDTPELVLRTQRQIFDAPEIFPQLPLPAPHGDNLYLFRPDAVADQAQLAGPLLTGLAAELDDGCHVGPYAVIDGCQLGAGARVRNAVLYGMGPIEGEWVDCLAIAGKVAQAKFEHEP